MLTIVFLLVLSYRLFVLILSAFTCCKRTPIYIASPRVMEQYVFLFPVYKEQAIIQDTLQYYEKFLANSENISLLFISTCKESLAPTTHTLIARYRQQSKYANRIQVIQSPYKKGTKATQLNVGLRLLKRRYPVLPRLVCFDCDARISWQDFWAAEQYIQNHPKPLLFSFLPQADLVKNSLIIQALMVRHSERMLAFEYSAISHNAGFWHYPMGATMVILPEVWQRVTQFPEPIDDIPLSYLLRWQKIRFASLPFSTHIQSPPDTTNAFRQMIPIFKGVFSYFSTAKSSGQCEVRSSKLRQEKISLSFFQKILGIALYLFFLLEFLSIALLPLALVYQFWLLPVLFLTQVVLDLLWLKKLSISNAMLHLLGYFLRLGQFFYFIWYGLLFPQELGTYKTIRK